MEVGRQCTEVFDRCDSAGIGAENGCLEFATGWKEEADFNDGRILLVRNWYGGFLAAILAFIFWCVAVSKSNPSWGRRRSGGRSGRVWR
jgi:hypothetical protein